MKQTTQNLNNLRKNDDSKLKLYSSFLSFDDNHDTTLAYLKLNLTQFKTSIITQFRISAYTLNFRKGRHARPKVPRDKRTCKYCDEVGSEAHFILYCNTYDNLRNVLFKEFGVDRTRLCTNNELEVLNLLLNPVGPKQPN